MSTGTASHNATDARAALQDRLDELIAQRTQLELDCALAVTGDSIDRTIDAGAQIHLAELDRHIENLTLRLQERPSVRVVRGDDLEAHLGSTVTLSFDGDTEPETYVLDQIDQTLPGTAVITPDSPLGKVVLGAKAGAKLIFRTKGQRTMSVSVLDVAPA